MSDFPKIEVISLKESPRIRSNFVRELFPDMILTDPFETPSLLARKAISPSFINAALDMVPASLPLSYIFGGKIFKVFIGGHGTDWPANVPFSLPFISP